MTETPLPDQPTPAKSAWPITIGCVSMLIFCWELDTYDFLFEQDKSLFAADQSVIATLAIVAGLTLTLILPVVLLIAAVLTCKRKANGPTLHLIWAYLRLFLGALLLSAIVICAWQVDSFGVNIILKSLLRLLEEVSWPIFLLIWFSRKKIRDEVRSWGKE